MSQGLPQGYARLVDEDGNEVRVRITQDGSHALETHDEELVREVRDVLRRLPAEKKAGPWAIRSAW